MGGWVVIGLLVITDALEEINIKTLVRVFLYIIRISLIIHFIKKSSNIIPVCQQRCDPDRGHNISYILQHDL
jgi:hypothetical protein